MEELKDILAGARDRSLILIDEIASGTNPVEGQALTESIIKFLVDKPYISLITTHFDVMDERAVNLQVRGLADADFRRLNSELSGAGLGGCVLILVEKEKTDAVMDRLNREFYDRLGLPHAAFVCCPSSGSRVFY